MSLATAQPPGRGIGPAAELSARRTAMGSAWLLLAQGLMLPAGLATLVYLSRTLGPSVYGQYATVMALLVWLEFGLSAILIRSSVKMISQSDDPRGTAAGLLRLAALIGAGGAAALWLTAAPLAGLLGDPALTAPLRLAAADLPLFVLAAIYQSAVTAMGRFGRRALITAFRWPLRLGLAVLFVEMGYGLSGALWAVIGASLAELLAGVCIHPLRIWRARAITGRLHLVETLPLFASSLALRAMDGADLLLLRGFGADAADAGIYAVSMNLAVIPGLMSMAIYPTLMSTLIRMHRAGREPAARRLCAAVMRAGVWLIPPTAAVTVAAPALVVWCFEEAYAEAGPLLRVLLWGGLARLIIAVGGAMLAGSGRSAWAWWAVAPAVPVALVGYLLLIPRFGPMGAAWSTTLAGAVGVAVTIGFLSQRLGLAPPWRTLAAMTPVALLSIALAWAVGDRGAPAALVVGLLTLLSAAVAWWRRDWRLPGREGTGDAR
jgi:O-antigen/teichoic acid export membrane protein